MMHCVCLSLTFMSLIKIIKDTYYAEFTLLMLSHNIHLWSVSGQWEKKKSENSLCEVTNGTDTSAKIMTTPLVNPSLTLPCRRLVFISFQTCGKHNKA